MSPYRTTRSLKPRRLAAQTLRHSLTLLSLVAAPLLISSVAQETPVDPSRIIQYRGPMPLLPREHWGGGVELQFELYRSPDGGVPFWKETRTVPVGKDGWLKVDLGQVRPLPDEAFTTPFRFLSIRHDDIEFTPRKQIASLAYVALTAKQPGQSGEPREYPGDGNAPAQKAVAEARATKTGFDTLVDCGAFRMEAHPRPATNWLAAVESARLLEGGRLPTFEEWYGAYDGNAAHQLAGMAGHYEWVIPWVYEPTIHARLHELYRGKPVACYYEELSPLNNYQFRLVVVERPADVTP